MLSIIHFRAGLPSYNAICSQISYTFSPSLSYLGTSLFPTPSLPAKGEDRRFVCQAAPDPSSSYCDPDLFEAVSNWMTPPQCEGDPYHGTAISLVHGSPPRRQCLSTSHHFASEDSNAYGICYINKPPPQEKPSEPHSLKLPKAK